MKPELVLFDYGNTLVTEQDWNAENGNKALLKSTGFEDPELLSRIIEYGKTNLLPKIKDMRENNIEVSGAAYSRALFGNFGINLDMADEEIERIFWYAASKGEAVDGAEDLLELLDKNGIQTGIISNMMWSGKVLRKRLERIFHLHRFDFVLTSADYIYRKPDPCMFNIAALLSKTDKSRILYCGDNPEADIEGAAKAGIFPIFFRNYSDSRGYGSDKTPECEYTEINKLNQIKDLID